MQCAGARVPRLRLVAARPAAGAAARGACTRARAWDRDGISYPGSVKKSVDVQVFVRRSVMYYVL